MKRDIFLLIGTIKFLKNDPFPRKLGAHDYMEYDASEIDNIKET
ncbi:hypothetical protein [Flavobacterium sp.]|nr:hypothetical protein [Flavobacterium sp.]